MGSFLFQSFVEDTSFPSKLSLFLSVHLNGLVLISNHLTNFHAFYYSGIWLLLMEINPGFSLFRGLYEFAQYTLFGSYVGTSGMRWTDLSDPDNGTKDAMLIMLAEWLVLLPVAYYMNQIGTGTRNDSLNFLTHFHKSKFQYYHKSNNNDEGLNVSINMDKTDVSREVS